MQTPRSAAQRSRVLVTSAVPLTLYGIVGVKNSYNCEMGMRGTVRYRPTLAYKVHFDGINISD